MEAGIKLVGLGMKQYFKDPWNKFDFTLVSISTITLLLEAFESPIPASLLRVIRYVRIYPKSNPNPNPNPKPH